MRKLTAITFAILVIAGTGCTMQAQGPPFEPVSAPYGDAVVYVYRSSNDVNGSAVVLDIKCDGTAFGSLKESGYVYVVVPAGRHTISSDTEITAQVPFNAEQGKSYYIEAEVQLGFWVGRPKLVMVPEDTGKLAILSTRESDAKYDRGSPLPPPRGLNGLAR